MWRRQWLCWWCKLYDFKSCGWLLWKWFIFCLFVFNFRNPRKTFTFCCFISKTEASRTSYGPCEQRVRMCLCVCVCAECGLICIYFLIFLWNACTTQHFCLKNKTKSNVQHDFEEKTRSTKKEKQLIKNDVNIQLPKLSMNHKRD